MHDYVPGDIAVRNLRDCGTSDRRTLGQIHVLVKP